MMPCLKHLLLLTLATSGCRSTAPKEPVSQPMGLFGAACARLEPVRFEATNSGGLALIDTPPKSPMRIDISAQDLANAKSLSCKKDGLCEAILNRPVSFDETVPVALNTKIRLAYEQKPDKDGEICLRDIKVGGQISPMAHCLGKLVYANIDVGVNVTQNIDKDSKESSFSARPYCKASVGCNTPFLSIGMSADDKGIGFNGILSTKGLTDNRFLKRVLPTKIASSKVSYKELPAAIQKLKATVAVVADAIKDPDFTWDQIAESCDPRT